MQKVRGIAQSAERQSHYALITVPWTIYLFTHELQLTGCFKMDSICNSVLSFSNHSIPCATFHGFGMPRSKAAHADVASCPSDTCYFGSLEAF